MSTWGLNTSSPIHAEMGVEARARREQKHTCGMSGAQTEDVDFPPGPFLHPYNKDPCSAQPVPTALCYLSKEKRNAQVK